jgi:hypothetical protein
MDILMERCSVWSGMKSFSFGESWELGVFYNGNKVIGIDLGLTSSIHQLDCIKHLAVEEQLVLLVVLEVDLAVNESIGYWPATIEPMKAAISSACTCIRHKLRHRNQISERVQRERQFIDITFRSSA